MTSHHFPIVRLEGVSLGYGRATPVVRDVSLRIGGGLTVLLGPNGAGKSTLLRIFATALQPSEGRVRVRGVDVGNAPWSKLRDVRKSIGYLPQENPLIPSFSLREFVTYVGWNRAMSSREARAAAEAALESVGLGERAGDKVHELSGGMQRRLGLAGAIVNDPELLLLDEPGAGLDPRQRALLRQLIIDLAADRTVVAATHTIADVEVLRPRVVVLNHGMVQFDGTSDQLVELSRLCDDPGSDVERGYFVAVSGTPHVAG